MMKKILYILLLALCACKTQSTIALRAHNPQSTIIRDSVSVTYKQGTEQPTPTGVIGAAHSSICVIKESEQKQPCQSKTLTSCEAHSTGKACALATRNKKSEAIAMAANSPQGVRNSEASGRLIIRVDTVFIERWHTEQVTGNRRQETSYIKHQTFYKRCTAGFWVLLIGILIWIALRVWKAIYLKK